MTDVKDELCRLVQDQAVSCNFSMEDDCRVFPSGEPMYVCTSWALDVRERLGEERVRIFGFFSEQNPSALISKDYDGHDFAVVDGRYIVDGWSGYASLERPGRASPGVFDLLDSDDHVEIVRVYGARGSWISNHLMLPELHDLPASPGL